MGLGGNQGPPGSIPGVPFQEGEDARRGKGKKGASGRPSNDVRETFQVLLRGKRGKKSAYDVCADILADASHPQWGTAFKTAMAYGHGQPKASVQIEGEVPVIRIVRDQAAVQAAVRGDQAADDE